MQQLLYYNYILGRRGECTDERKAIERWLETHTDSPMTHEWIGTEGLRVNWALKKLIAEWSLTIEEGEARAQ